MRIVSYNIHKSVGLDYKRKPERILDVLNEINADIVCLQEVDRRVGQREATITRKLLCAHTDYQPVDVSIREQSLGWHGNVILVRKAHKVQKTWRIDLHTLEPRGAIAANVCVGGRNILCIATHLALLKRIRVLQMQSIAKALDVETSDYPVVIAGDFNERKSSKTWVHLFGKGYHSLDPPATFHSAMPFMGLDRIVVSENIRISTLQAHHSKKSRMASDHLPLCADLKFNP